MKQNTYWMPFQTGEFLAETANLNTIQIGAYTLLLIHYWHKRGLPADDQQLARIAKLTVRGWLNIRTAIAPLFGTGWTHARVDKELTQRDLLTARRAAAGAKGGHRKQMNKCDEPAHKIALQIDEKGHIQTRTNLLSYLKRH